MWPFYQVWCQESGPFFLLDAVFSLYFDFLGLFCVKQKCLFFKLKFFQNLNDVSMFSFFETPQNTIFPCRLGAGTMGGDGGGVLVPDSPPSYLALGGGSCQTTSLEPASTFRESLHIKKIYLLINLKKNYPRFQKLCRCRSYPAKLGTPSICNHLKFFFLKYRVFCASRCFTSVSQICVSGKFKNSAKHRLLETFLSWHRWPPQDTVRLLEVNAALRAENVSLAEQAARPEGFGGTVGVAAVDPLQ